MANLLIRYQLFPFVDSLTLGLW